MKLKSRKGFTLIEVLLVLGMIALLTTLALPKLTGIYEEAAKAKAKADAQIIVAAILREELRYELGDVGENDKWYTYLEEDSNDNSDKIISENVLLKLHVKLNTSSYKFYCKEDNNKKRYISVEKEDGTIVVESVTIDD